MFNIRLLDNYKIYSILLLLLFLIINLILRNFYIVAHDNETDLIGNALHILEHGNQYSSHHPGVFTYYYISLILFFLNTINLSFDHLILTTRFIYISTCISIIYFSYYFYFKDNLNKFIISLLVFSFCTPLYYFSTILSPEPIIYSVCFLLLSNLYYKKNDNLNFSLAIFLFCLLISIKFTSVILFPVLILFIYKHFRKINVKLKIRNYLSIILLFSLSLVLLFSPIIGILPLTIISTIINIYNKFYNVLGINTLILIPIIILGIGSLYLLLYKKKLKIDTLLNIYIFGLLLLFIILPLFNLILKNDFNFENYIIQIRHSVILLPFLILINLKISKIIMFFIFMLTILSYPIFANKYFKSESDLDNFLLENRLENIYLYQESEFNSKFYFLHWSNLTYGNNKLNYNSIIKKKYLDVLNNTKILLTREHGFTPKEKNHIFVPNSFKSFIINRHNILQSKTKDNYNMGFWLNSLYGFTPHFNNYKKYSICKDQLKNIDTGYFVITKFQTKYIDQEIKRVEDILKSCSFKVTSINKSFNNLFYFRFYK